MVVVSGTSGDYAGAAMIAGTLVLLGKTGNLPGYSCRGSRLGRGAQSLSPIADCGPHELAFAALLGNALAEHEVKTGKLFKGALRRLAGDLGARQRRNLDRMIRSGRRNLCPVGLVC